MADIFIHVFQMENCSAKITPIGMHEYGQRRANTWIKVICYDFQRIL